MCSAAPTDPASAADRRRAVTAAVEALDGLVEVLYQVPCEELASLAGDLAEVGARADAARVAVVHDAQDRGVVPGSQASSARMWLAQSDRRGDRARAGVQAKAAREVLARPDVEPVREAVLGADMSAALATAVVAEYDTLRAALDSSAHDTCLREMLTVAVDHGAGAVRELRSRWLSAHGHDDALEVAARQAATGVVLVRGRRRGDLVDYRLTLDDASRAVVEAAVGPLSRPVPGPDGSGDGRSPAQRRGQALVEVARRVAAGVDAGRTSRAPKATLMITMSVDELTSATGGAAGVVGTLAAGAVLDPTTVRQVACDAELIPVMLDSDRVPIEMGRAVRCFEPGQVRALWLRDRGCSFPECDIPAAWCDAHHVRHWIDGGPTDLDNGALLCPRHHTIVHRDRLVAHLTRGRMLWDTAIGSYDRARAPTTATA